MHEFENSFGILKFFGTSPRICIERGEELARPLTQKNNGLAEILITLPHLNSAAKGLGNAKQQILSKMNANPKISGTKLAEIIQISVTAVEKHIRKLRDDGLLERIGVTQGH